MSITINIDLDPTRGPLDEQLAAALAAFGFERRSLASRAVTNAEIAGAPVAVVPSEPSVEAAREALAEMHGTLAPEIAEQAPDRKRGEPSPGRKRRTKEEIAEDEAAERAEVRRLAPESAEQAELDRAQTEAERALISTGGERVGPEDDPEIAARDAADEAAEVEASRDPQNPLTLDDLRLVVGEYNKKVGLAVSAKQVPIILGCKMTEVPDTQEALAEAIAKVQAAIGGDAPAAQETAGKPEKAKVHTRKDVEDAIVAYAAKFGDEAAKADRQAIMVKALGPTPAGMTNSAGAPVAHWTVPNIPNDKFADVVRYYEAALAEDPFKRGGK